MNIIDELIERAADLRNILLEVKDLSNQIYKIGDCDDDNANDEAYAKVNKTIMLGQAINTIANEKQMTKYRIAKNAGIPHATLSEIASGKNNNPTIETVSKIANGLGITITELIREAEGTEKEGIRIE